MVMGKYRVVNTTAIVKIKLLILLWQGEILMK